jgi:hypothetical protein
MFFLLEDFFLIVIRPFFQYFVLFEYCFAQVAIIVPCDPRAATALVRRRRFWTIRRTGTHFAFRILRPGAHHRMEQDDAKL